MSLWRKVFLAQSNFQSLSFLKGKKATTIHTKGSEREHLFVCVVGGGQGEVFRE